MKTFPRECPSLLRDRRLPPRYRSRCRGPAKIFKPWRTMSSPVLTITVTSPGPSLHKDRGAVLSANSAGERRDLSFLAGGMEESDAGRKPGATRNPSAPDRAPTRSRTRGEEILPADKLRIGAPGVRAKRSRGTRSRLAAARSAATLLPD